MKQVARALNRLCLALLFGLLGSVPFIIPLPERIRSLVVPIGYVFDLPVALVTWLGIPYVAGVDVYRFEGVGEFIGAGEMLVWHLRVAVPLYLALLYLPGVVVGVVKHRRGEDRDRMGAA